MKTSTPPTTPTPSDVHALAKDGLELTNTLDIALGDMQSTGEAHWLDLSDARGLLGDLTDILHKIQGNQ